MPSVPTWPVMTGLLLGLRFFPWSFLEQSSCCPKVGGCFCFTRLSFSPYPFSRNRRLSLGLSCMVSWHFCVFHTSSTQFGKCEGKKENPTSSPVYCPSGTDIPGQCIYFSSLFRVSCIFVLYELSRVFSLPQQKQGKVCLSHIGLDIPLNIIYKKLNHNFLIYCPTPQSKISYYLRNIFRNLFDQVNLFLISNVQDLSEG